jgi:hypothetical protein
MPSDRDVESLSLRAKYGRYRLLKNDFRGKAAGRLLAQSQPAEQSESKIVVLASEFFI